MASKALQAQMSSHDVFLQDLARGQEVERQVLKMIQRKCPCACIVNGFKGYDIWIPEIHKSVEVKYDPMSMKTGNVVIEIEFNNHASALMTTTANWWIIYDDHQYMRFTPQQILQCIFMNKLSYTTFTGRGDNNDKKAFLIKKDLLFKHGKEFK
jgi:hypothetical protein